MHAPLPGFAGFLWLLAGHVRTFRSGCCFWILQREGGFRWLFARHSRTRRYTCRSLQSLSVLNSNSLIQPNHAHDARILEVTEHWDTKTRLRKDHASFRHLGFDSLGLVRRKFTKRGTDHPARSITFSIRNFFFQEVSH